MSLSIIHSHSSSICYRLSSVWIGFDSYCSKLPCMNTQPTSSANGFTLLELLLVLTLSSLLLSSALVLSSYWVQKIQLAQTARHLLDILNFARSHAISAEQRTTLCASASGTHCDTRDYQRGWLVFTEHPTTANGKLDNNEAVLLLRQNAIRPFSIRSNSFANFISYNHFGQANRPGRFVFCTDRATGADYTLFVSQSGRIRLATDTNADPTDISLCSPNK